MLTTIKLLGVLGQKFGRVHRFDIATPAEAIRALSSQIKGFAQFLNDSHHVYRVVKGNPEGLSDEELLLFNSTGQLVIAPMVEASGNFGKIILGAAMIATAFLVPGGIFGISSMTIGLMGASLLLSGISGLLTKKPKSKKDPANTDSNGFGRNQSTGTQGYPVPILYGEFLYDAPIVVSAATHINEAPV